MTDEPDKTARRNQSRKLVTQPVGAVDRRKHPRGLTRAVRTAIDAIIYDRRSRAAACDTAGISERALYLALEKVEVASYWNAALQVLRTGERPRNIHRLAEIRDKADNMPAVQAIKALEQITSEEAAHRPRAPFAGLVVQVINAPPLPLPARTIDAQPVAAELPVSDHGLEHGYDDHTEHRAGKK